MSGDISWWRSHRRSLLALTALLTVAGIASVRLVPVSLFPRATFPRVVVSVDAGARPADRMAIEVTRPLEETLRAVPSMRTVRSTSSRGSSEISLTFDWGIDMTAATLQVQSALAAALPGLPAGVSFEVRRMDPTVFPIIGLSLTSASRSPADLRDLARFDIAPLLLAIPGVARVEPLGGQTEEIQVLVDLARLEAAGVTLEDVANAVTGANVVEALGRIEADEKLYLLLADSQFGVADELNAVVVRHSPAGVVLLSDLAEVRVGTQPEWTRVTADGADAVLVNVFQQPDANALEIARGVAQQLAAFQARTGTDLAIHTWYDQTELITASLRSVEESIAIGMGLAMLVLWGFLRTLRTTLVASISVPIVLAITLLILASLGQGLNLMTLGGLAAAVGLIIDDSIVVVEHIVRRRGAVMDGRPVTALDAAREMARPLLGSSLATVVIFAPLALLSGVPGVFFRPLSLTMAVALTISFGVALAVVPLLADIGFDNAQPLATAAPDVHRLRAGYERLLRGALRRPWIGPAVMVLLGALAGGAFLALGTGFLPSMDEGGFVLDYRTPAGTSLTETDRRVREVERILSSIPQVSAYSRRTGLQLGGGLTEANEGDFFVHLTAPPRRPISAVMREVRARVEGEIPGIEIELMQLVEDVIGDLTAVPQPVEVKLFGADPALLRSEVERVAAAIGDVPGVVDERNGVVLAGDGIDVRVDRVKANLLGLDPAQVARRARLALDGEVVTALQRPERMVGVRVWAAEAGRAGIEQIANLRLPLPAGGAVRLKRIATLVPRPGQPQLTREDLKPMVAATARIAGRDLGSVMADVQRAVARVPLPAGVYVEYGGLYREQQESFASLTMVLAAATMLVCVVLLVLYERWTAPVAVLFVAMAGGAGVCLGLWATGTELNVASMVGLTMIVGIASEASIFFISERDILLATMDVDDATVAAAVGRARPVLMTVLAAIFALLPLALGIGQGGTMLQPLAVAVVSGLIATIPGVLLLLPLLTKLLEPARPTPQQFSS